MSDHATKQDINRLEVSVGKAHERIDEVVKDVSDMRESVGRIEGCMDGLCKDVGTIKDSFVKRAESGSGQSELFKTIRWLIAAAVIGGMVAAGMSSFSASNGATSIETSK